MNKANIILVILATALAATAVSAQNTLFLRESPIAWLDDNDEKEKHTRW